LNAHTRVISGRNHAPKPNGKYRRYPERYAPILPALFNGGEFGDDVYSGMSSAL